MEFKQPSSQDAVALLAFFSQLVERDPERVERPTDVRLLNPDKEAIWIGKLLEKEAAGEAIVLCVLNKASVIVGLGEVERRPRWIERHVAEIRFGLLPDYAEEGRELVRLLETRAKAIGIECLYYFHLATQSQGIAVVKTCGFELAGTLPGYYKRESGYVDRVFYTKNIT